MAGFSAKERREAERLCADARARIADVARRAATAPSREEHVQLGRERAKAFGDLKSATFVLTDEPEAGEGSG